jgi:hypothetical protein
MGSDEDGHRRDRRGEAGLDVHLLPAGEAVAVARDAAGIDALIGRPLAPAMVAVEATGGLESVVAAGLGQSGAGARLRRRTRQASGSG